VPEEVAPGTPVSQGIVLLLASCASSVELLHSKQFVSKPYMLMSPADQPSHAFAQVDCLEIKSSFIAVKRNIAQQLAFKSFTQCIMCTL
jgi:hypothetical protein